MSKFQCPYPESLNPLSPTGFQLIISKLPGVNFFCQTVTLPEVSIYESNQNTSLVDFGIPGEKLIYSPLQVNFLIDENMSNYKEVYNWLLGLGYPNDNEEYLSFINSQDSGLSELQKMYSDAKLIVLGNNLNPIQTITFKDTFPISLGSLEFSTIESNVNYLTASLTLNYTNFTFD